METAGETKLDLKEIAIFAAFGFFLGNNSFQTVSRTADSNSIRNYKWHYTPKSQSFENSVEEFSWTFKSCSEGLNDFRSIILPLSGGIDSRSQATLLKGNSNVQSYSYSFEGGIDENVFGSLIAEACNFRFKGFIITKGYLWHEIETLASWNGCESEFTHPRQMAIDQDYEAMGDVFFLGHWGDVLFDSGGIHEKAGDNEQVACLKKKMLKKGGLELAESLWQNWNIAGSFEEYLDERLSHYLSEIDIDHAGAKIRAFKSLHWLPRWTLTNLCVFKQYHPLVLPYCDTRMFDLVCTTPEEYLDGRKIQIEYIKRYAPELAKISWQRYSPQNLYDYHEFKSLKYWPRRGWGRIKREYNTRLKGKKLIQRNWEIQFLGHENDRHLRSWLFENPKFNDWVSNNLVKEFYHLFKNRDPIYYSHPLSMLLTLSVFSKIKL